MLFTRLCPFRRKHHPRRPARHSIADAASRRRHGPRSGQTQTRETGTLWRQERQGRDRERDGGRDRGRDGGRDRGRDRGRECPPDPTLFSFGLCYMCSVVAVVQTRMYIIVYKAPPPATLPSLFPVHLHLSTSHVVSAISAISSSPHPPPAPPSPPGLGPHRTPLRRLLLLHADREAKPDAQRTRQHRRRVLGPAAGGVQRDVHLLDLRGTGKDLEGTQGDTAVGETEHVRTQCVRTMCCGR